MERIALDFYKALLDNLYDGVYFVDLERRITYWNKGAERLSGYSPAEVIGTFCHNDLLRHITEDGHRLCQEGCPLAETIVDGQLRETEAYLHHKEGYRVPVFIRTAPLRAEDNRIVGGVEIFSDNASLVAIRKRIAELEERSLIDQLTQVGTRRFVEMTLNSRLDEMRRYGWPFGALFIDVDHFKTINDTFGHAVGDEVLRMVGKTLMVCVRTGDCVGRWGGEEFVVVAANVHQEELQTVAERIRMLVEKSSVPCSSGVIRVTVSIGAAAGRTDDTAESLINRADQLMYQSKLSGRNRISLDGNTGAASMPS